MALAPIEIMQGDILKTDWSDADILYISSVCFPDVLYDGIADLCEKLKTGTKIVTLKEIPERPYFSLQAVLKIRMTWGRQNTFVYLKT